MDEARALVALALLTGRPVTIACPTKAGARRLFEQAKADLEKPNVPAEVRDVRAD